MVPDRWEIRRHGNTWPTGLACQREGRSAITVHVGSDDIPARAVPISDSVFRRRVFEDGTASWYSTQVELDLLVEKAPMVEVLFDSD